MGSSSDLGSDVLSSVMLCVWWYLGVSVLCRIRLQVGEMMEGIRQVLHIGSQFGGEIPAYNYFSKYSSIYYLGLLDLHAEACL